MPALRLLSLLLALTCFALFAGQAAAAPNAIQAENSLPGTPGWDDFASVAQQDAISGYASKTSVTHGDSLDLFVTTTAPSFTIDVYRTGYYQGIGARRVASLGAFPGVHQAIPLPDPQTGKVECRWTKTTTLTIPASWVTGVYLARLTASDGRSSYIVFTVRNDGGTEPILFQSSVTTYQAYNAWGGTSLYDNRTNGSSYRYPMATKVSFDRPYDPLDSNGAGQFLAFEYPYIRWAESQGYDISYITDVDTHTNVNPLTSHKVFLSLGHDEYWSKGMRDNVVGAIAQGVNVAFFSANSAYWQIRFEPDAAGNPNRTQVTYKDAATSSAAPGPDPMWGVNNAIVTVRWRDAPVNLPENSFLGVMYQDQVNTNGAYTVVNSSDPLYAGTGFVDGSKVAGIVGYEYDKTFNNGFQPPGVKILSSSPVVGCCEGSGNSLANSTVYTAPSGARVFASGTIQWSWALDPYSGGTANAGIQKTTANILTAFSSGGTTAAPAVALSPASLAFGSQTVGAAGAAQTETVTNSGSAPLSITSIGFSGTNPADFARTTTCPVSPATLAAGASCTVSVTFTPGATGSRAANLVIADNATGTPHTVGLTGTGTAQAVTLTPTSLAFGSQRVGQASAARTTSLRNSGTAPLTISSIAVAGASAGDYAQTSDCPLSPLTLAAGASCTVLVTFTPGALGSRSASLVVTDNAPDTPQSVALSGTGVAPAVSLTPTSLEFGSPLIGSTSAAQTAVVRNTGTSTLTFSASGAISIGGSEASDYSQTNDCGATLAVNATCTISVRFSPTAAGSRSATLTVSDDAAGSPQSVALSGAGATPAPAVSLTPASLSFGTRLVGSSSPAQTSTLKNTGSGALSIASIAVTGSEGADFARSDDCPATLAGGASCTVSVVFTPGAAGSRSASVTVTDDAAGSPHSIALTGTGATPAPALTAAPASIDFGAQAVGAASAARTTVLKNTGTATLAIASIAVTGDYTQTNDCTATLAVDATCTVSVVFTPTTTGARAGSVVVTDDAADSPQNVGLTGTGTAPAVALTPASLSLGATNVGSTSAAQTATLRNSGTATLSIAGISVGGADADQFAQTNTCGATLAPTATCSISVRFSPTGTGARSASLSVADDAPGSPHTVALSGTGSTGAPAVSLTPTTLGFARQQIGVASTAKTTTLKNTGTAPLTISGIAFTGANPGDFNQTSTCPAAPATLDAGASCVISVTFGPGAAGSRAASLAISDDAPASPQTVALTGTGVYFAEDFESANLSRWTIAGTGTATAQAAQKHAGASAASLAASATQSISMWSALSSAQTQTYTRFYFRWTGLTGVVPIAYGTDVNDKRLWEVDFRVTQRSPSVIVWNGAGTKTSFNTSSGSIPANQWHSIELRVNEATSGLVEIWVDGTSMNQRLPNLSVPLPYARLYLANSAGGTAFFDDVFVSSTYVGP